MSRQSKFFAFGELLCRLDTPGHRRLLQSQQLEMTFTGGEANVGVSLSLWGQEASIISAVPANEFGDACVNFLKQYGVDTTHVLRGQHRLGIFFVEAGAGQRSTNVIYDRLDTSFRNMNCDDLNWQDVLHEDAWIHFTGTALVSPTTRRLLLEGLQYGKQVGATISFDVSYRSQLWSIAAAMSAYEEVIQYVDVLFGSQRDAQTFFGINQTGQAAISELRDKHGFQAVAFSERLIDDQGVNYFSGQLCTSDEIFCSQASPTSSIDRIGTGDAFAAGIIHHLMQGAASQDGIEFATAAAVLKHTVPGDFALLEHR